MGQVYVHNGAWTAINDMKVNRGSWSSSVNRVWVNNGGWVLAWENEITETFPFVAGKSYSGTGTDAQGFLATDDRTDSVGVRGIFVGDGYGNGGGSGFSNNRGMWQPGVGSNSGQTIQTTLAGRTIVRFRIALVLDGSYVGDWNGNGVPTHFNIWGTTYTSPPVSLATPNLVYLATVSYYPGAPDYAPNTVITQQQLGTNPPVFGDREGNHTAWGTIDITKQLSPTLKAKLTDGVSIRGFVLQAYWRDSLVNFTGDSNFRHYMLFPGQSYRGGTGNADAFRVEITHRG